jgi:mRNA interferase HicA
MTKSELLKHLQRSGCQLVRQGKHEIWFNPRTGMTSPVPRHHEIDKQLVRKICRELGIDRPDSN